MASPDHPRNAGRRLPRSHHATTGAEASPPQGLIALTAKPEAENATTAVEQPNSPDNELRLDY
jgi:hypothetical protein